ncbi:MAG: hypothetical protein OXL34_08980 [Gemmatimonadota bacterium]|nr:hypothetical protein [Gemmatimonadota bacterium]
MAGNEADISDRLFTPTRVGDLADQLEEAIRKMRNLGIRIPPNCRLALIARVLRDVAPTLRFPESPDKLIEIGHAVRDGQEFVEISWVLPTERLAPTVQEKLQKAVFGVLGQTGTRPYQYQSELWVGAALLRSGASAEVVTDTEGKHPDFVVRRGTALFPVEVKRPQTIGHARNLVSEAARQLGSRQRQYHGGALVVDLTDCLGPDSAIHLDVGPPDLVGIQSEAIKLTSSLHSEVFDGASARIRERRRHMFGVTTFVRATWWDLTDLTQIHPYRFVLPVSYLGRPDERERRSLAQWLAQLIDRGMRETGHQDLGKREVSFG